MFVVNSGLNMAEKIVEKASTVVLNLLTGDGGALQNMIFTLNKLSEESGKLGKMTQLRLLALYNNLQDIAMAKFPELVFGPAPKKSSPIIGSEEEQELAQAAAELNFYCRFAAGAYGDLVNNVVSGKNLGKLFDPNDTNDEFVQYTRIDANQLIYSQWEAEALLPAHALVILKERKEVLVVIRGSYQAGDFITDLIASYVEFAIMEEPNGNRYLKIIQNPNDVEIESSNGLNEESKESSSIEQGQDKVLYTGRAHSGIFTSGIEIYKKIRMLVEDAFAKVPKGYNLKITGHSLGGGMTYILTMLFLIHPPRYFWNTKSIKDLQTRIKGYTFGSPQVLSRELEPLMAPCIINCINEFDMVPRLNYGSLKDLDSVMVELAEKEKTDELVKNAGNFKYMKKDYEMSDKELSDLQHYQEFYQHLREKVLNNPKLPHLGRTYFLKKQHEPEYTKNGQITYSFRQIFNENFCQDIIICMRMLPFHFPNFYQEGLCNELIFK